MKWEVLAGHSRLAMGLLLRKKCDYFLKTKQIVDKKVTLQMWMKKSRSWSLLTPYAYFVVVKNQPISEDFFGNPCTFSGRYVCKAICTVIRHWGGLLTHNLFLQELRLFVLFRNLSVAIHFLNMCKTKRNTEHSFWIRWKGCGPILIWGLRWQHVPLQDSVSILQTLTAKPTHTNDLA